LSLIAGLPVAASTAPRAGAVKPNIVFIMSDDLGWRHPGFNGGDPRFTPNLDRLAKEGLRLTQFYAQSVCSPTRTALLTGRYPFRTWMDWRSEDFGKSEFLQRLGLTLPKAPDGQDTRRIHGLDPKERTLATALREAGYYTAITGKWHLGEWQKEHLPLQRGFDHQYGHYAWGIDYSSKMILHHTPAHFTVYDWHRNEQPLQEHVVRLAAILGGLHEPVAIGPVSDPWGLEGVVQGFRPEVRSFGRDLFDAGGLHGARDRALGRALLLGG
jgi:arylsulfatase A-like enzyme